MYFYIVIYIYIHICNHEKNVPSQSSPQWLCSNSCTWEHDVYYVPKCMSCYKAIVVTTGRAHCFHDCIYITPILLLWDLRNLCVMFNSDHLYISLCIYIFTICIYIYIYIMYYTITRLTWIFSLLGDVMHGIAMAEWRFL